MKIVIQSSSNTKLYSGELVYEKIAQFLKENFGENVQEITYADKEGDKISITSQSDVDVLKELTQGKVYIKFDVVCSSDPKPQVESLNTEAVETESAEELIAETEQKERAKKEEEPKEEKPRKGGKWKKLQEEKDQAVKKHCKKDALDRPLRGEAPENLMHIVESTLNRRVAQMVDERIKNLIPCIKNQVDPNFEVLVDGEYSHLIHEGTTCKGCGMSPIKGIRYSCVESTLPNYDLCAVCENKLQPEYNMLKIRKVQPVKSESKDFGEVGVRLIRRLMELNQSREGGRHESAERRGPRRNMSPQRRENLQQERQQGRFNRRTDKLTEIFGERDFSEFIKQTMQMRCPEIIKLYAEKNQIDLTEFKKKRCNVKLTKLSAFYNEPRENFTEIVKENPDMNFREIIRMLKEKGLRNHSGANFKQMREKLKEAEAEASEVETIETKPVSTKPVEEKPVQKESTPAELIVASEPKKTEEAPKEKKEPSPNSKKGAEMKEKGKILTEMKAIFQEADGREIFKFIEANFAQGREGIIDLWIQKNFA